MDFNVKQFANDIGGVYQGDRIEVITNKEYGEEVEILTPVQFAKNILGTYRIDGKEGLDKWMDEHGVDFRGVIDLIGTENIEKFPERAEWVNGEYFSPLETLMEMEKIYREPSRTASDVENAMAGSHVHNLRLNSLAENADRMSTADLEKAMIEAGMSVPRSTLMR